MTMTTETTEHYVVRTPTGYVGRTSTDTELVATQPRIFAYCYEADEAQTVAAEFGGTVEPM